MIFTEWQKQDFGKLGILLFFFQGWFWIPGTYMVWKHERWIHLSDSCHYQIPPETLKAQLVMGPKPLLPRWQWWEWRLPLPRFITHGPGNGYILQMLILCIYQPFKVVLSLSQFCRTRKPKDTKVTQASEVRPGMASYSQLLDSWVLASVPHLFRCLQVLFPFTWSLKGLAEASLSACLFCMLSLDAQESVARSPALQLSCMSLSFLSFSLQNPFLVSGVRGWGVRPSFC